MAAADDPSIVELPQAPTDPKILAEAEAAKDEANQAFKGEAGRRARAAIGGARLGPPSPMRIDLITDGSGGAQASTSWLRSMATLAPSI
jgi:hypothetical protein